MISVVQLGDGLFAVIDGMHRVTSLQQLYLEDWPDIPYGAVHPTPIYPHETPTHTHIHTHNKHKCTYTHTFTRMHTLIYI
jgi:hypothetical protein